MNEHRRVAVAIGLGVSFGVVLLAWVLASCGGGSALRVIAIEDRTGGAHIDSGALGRADAYARAQVGYAGEYFAHSTDWQEAYEAGIEFRIATYRFTSDNDQHADVLAALYPYALRIEEATFTFKELEQARERFLDEGVLILEEAGIRYTGVRLDVRTGVIRVRVASAAERARELLVDHFDVEIFETEVSVSTTSPATSGS